MKAALAIFLRASDKTDFNSEWESLGLDSETTDEIEESFEQVFVICVGANEKLKKSAQGEKGADNWRFYNPLPKGTSQREIAEYVRDTLFLRIAKHHPSLHLFWRPQWQEAMFALATVEASSNAVRWWAPRAIRRQLNNLPETPPEFLYRNLFGSVGARTALEQLLGDSHEMNEVRIALGLAQELHSQDRASVIYARCDH